MNKECKLNIALALLAFQNGNKDQCLEHVSKACTFGDDLTQFVSEVIPQTGSMRNGTISNPSENTLSPSLASDFLSLSSRVARELALAGKLDDDEELVEATADVYSDEDDLDDEDFHGISEASCIGPVRYIK
jgi:hypothetical protein